MLVTMTVEGPAKLPGDRSLILLGNSKPVTFSTCAGELLITSTEVGPNFRTTGRDSLSGSQAHFGRLVWTSQGVQIAPLIPTHSIRLVKDRNRHAACRS